MTTDNRVNEGGGVSPFRQRVQDFVEAPAFGTTIVTLICLNAVTLGVETFPAAEKHLPTLRVVDRFFVVIFVLEIALRIYAKGPSFFRSWWNVGDFLIIAGSALAASNLFAALRAFRILRVLRVVTAVPRMRTVVQALVDSIPGILSVAMVATLIVYVFAVIASSLFGATHPDYFGDAFISMYTLFQVITLEGWREIADAVQEQHAYAWLFFLVFVLVGTFTMLNLFIAIVVRVVEEEADETEDAVHKEADHVIEEIRKLSDKIDRLEARLGDRAD